MKKNVLLLMLVASSMIWAENPLSLEQCRQKALKHNKNIQMAEESVKAATELKKAAFAQFLPNFSANATYTWNQKNISLLSEDAYLPVYSMNADGSINYVNSWNNSWTVYNGTAVPLDASGTPFDPTTNPEKILWKNYALLPKSAMEFDIQNVFAGTIGFVQPIFMGGKIKELYNTAKYGENLAKDQKENKITDLLLEVDEAYWRVISIQNKENLAKQYCNLLTKVDENIAVMIEEGVATKADALKVKVKLNEAEVSKTKAQNGLSLSMMALNQLCGMPLDTIYTLADTELNQEPEQPKLIPIEEALQNRPEIKALTQMVNIAESNQKIMFSRFLPTIGLTGNYLVSNPNVYNGYANEFGGMFTFGVVANVPLFHFGDRFHTYNAAKAEKNIANLKLDESKEKIQLQIKQNSYKVAESIKKFTATKKNLEEAEENLRTATEGFNEGVITSTDLLGAQTAWLSAMSENIDANIDVHLCNLYLKQSLGTLTYSN